MADIQVFGKPIEKLIETVSSGIGALYKPRAMRNEADAEAYRIEKIAQAKAKASIIKSDAVAEIAERAKQRLYEQEMTRQVNLENIVTNAEMNLSDEVSSEPVDEGWRSRFFNNAQDISSSDLQEIWGKILSNEIHRPGSFSLRTLDILSNLSKSEALLFEKLLSLRVNNYFIIKDSTKHFKQFGISYADLLKLKHAGLLYNDDKLTVNFLEMRSFEYSVGKENRTFAVLNFNTLTYSLFTRSKNYELPVYSLTESGYEISKVISAPTNPFYIEHLIRYYKTIGYDIEDQKFMHPR